MRKKTLVNLFIWSVLLCIGGPLLCGGAILMIRAFVRGLFPLYVVLVILTAAMVLCGLVLGIIAWIGGLVKQGKQQEWGWFICTLLFGNLVLLIYLIAVPERDPQMFAVAYATPGAFVPVMPQQPAFQAPMASQPSALAVLEQRFARGEIDMATYQQMREMLARNS